MTTHAEASDRRTARENNQEQMARYQNNYRLEPNNPFKVERVEKLVEALMKDRFQEFAYDSEMSASMCLETAASIRRGIQALNFDRYKLVVSLSIVEKVSQSMHAGMGFLWDCKRDNYMTYVFEGRTFTAYCCVLALYYE